MKTRNLITGKIALLLFVLILGTPAQSQERAWGGFLSIGTGGTIFDFPDSAIIQGEIFSSIETEQGSSFIAIAEGGGSYRISTTPFAVRGGIFAGGGLYKGKVNAVLRGVRLGNADMDIEYTMGGAILGLMFLKESFGLYFDYGLGVYNGKIDVDILNVAYSFKTKNEKIHLIKSGAFFKLGNTPITLGVEFGGTILEQEDDAVIKIERTFFSGVRIGVLF